MSVPPPKQPLNGGSGGRTESAISGLSPDWTCTTVKSAEWRNSCCPSAVGWCAGTGDHPHASALLSMGDSASCFRSGLLKPGLGSGDLVLEKYEGAYLSQSGRSLRYRYRHLSCFGPFWLQRFRPRHVLEDLKNQYFFLTHPLPAFWSQPFKEICIQSLANCRDNGTGTLVTTQRQK